MESKYRYGQITKKVIVCFLTVFLLGCAEKPAQPQIDQRIFENGDIICRLGNGVFSKWFKEASTREKIYSHAGIIKIENDSVFVIHAEASEFTGIGFVQKENIQTFLKGVQTWALFRLPVEDSIKNNIAENADFYFRRNTSFDLDFDSSCDEKVYCTQLIALAVNKALDDKLIKPNLILRGKHFYGVDDVYLLPQIETVYKTAR